MHLIGIPSLHLGMAHMRLAFSHLPQLVHFSLWKTTLSSGFISRPSVWQILTQGGFSHPLRATIWKSPSMPTLGLDLYGAVLGVMLCWCRILLQVDVQERHPTHLSGWATLSLLLFLGLGGAVPPASYWLRFGSYLWAQLWR